MRSLPFAIAAAVVLTALQSTISTGHAAFPHFPVKPVRMVVPLAPGGGSDIVGRIVAQALTEYWGKSVVIDNRPGAGSVVGTSIVAKASADGYTLLVSSSSLAISPALYRNLDFDVRRDFAGVTLIASQPSMLVVHPAVPAATIGELIALAKAAPAKLAYASAGTGSASHLGSELLMHATKTELLHVPYKSAGQAATAVISGEAQVLLTNMASVLPYIASRRLRAIGVSSRERSAAAPQVPTLNESGLKGFEYLTWYAALVPARTDPALVEHLHAAIAHVLKVPDVAAHFAAQGLQTHGSSPAELDRYMKGEVKRWGDLVKSAGIRID